MAKFMNAEMLRLRDSLTCAHCKATFKGSDSQAWKVKYEQKDVYCSPLCRKAGYRNKVSKPLPNRGPCKTCGETFFSRSSKVYCSLLCYTKSDQMRAMLEENRAKALANRPAVVLDPAVEARRAEYEASMAKRRELLARCGTDTDRPLKPGRKPLIEATCLECEKTFVAYKRYGKRQTAKFCSKLCYRAFMATRFDRWIANPEALALPQCYDEFLNQEELRCMVEGCGWQGQGLTLHMNLAHGVSAQSFKRAAGFNLQTGVIAKPLAETLRARENIGVALEGGEVGRAAIKERAASGDLPIVKYKSLEAREHSAKGRALAGEGPVRCCEGCQKNFRQSTPFGRALFCSRECRSIYYSKRGKAKRAAKGRVKSRRPDGTYVWIEGNATAA